jgi:5-methylcytosine-specific restriction endonuclease McrA
MMSSVLVLNQNYEPLNVCNAFRAFVLIDGGKAEVLEHGIGYIRTPSLAYPRPSVIRLVYLIKRPRPRVRLTRREVFIRDHFTCQYCGLKTRDLTLDHVVPRHRGGKHVWENLVSACRSCNHRKGGKMLSEAHLTLRRLPFEPKANSYYLFGQYLDDNDEWGKFIPEWEKAG